MYASIYKKNLSATLYIYIDIIYQIFYFKRYVIKRHNVNAAFLIINYQFHVKKEKNV